MKLSEILKIEISASENAEYAEPNVLMFVDNCSIFWVAKDGYYVWLQDHKGIYEHDYIDETHPIEKVRPTEKDIEGVQSEGVYWMNGDFESPYHISDFEERISQINA